MTFGFGLGAGMRALQAAQFAMQTAGNNLANVNTPGYSRQRVELAAALPYMSANGFQIGTGVDARQITRLVDEGLERRLRLQTGIVASASLDQARFQEIEGIFNEPDGGLSELLGGYYGSISRLRSDPADRALRGGVAQAGDQLASAFNLVANRFGELQDSTFTEVRGLVRQVNQFADDVAALNAQIVSAEANGSNANDLRDMREQRIKQIAELLDTSAIERASGSVDLLVGGHLLVAGDRVSPLSVGKDGQDQTQVLIGRTQQAAAVREGRIAALLRHETDEMPLLQERVDRLARNLILETNRLHTTGMPRSGPFTTLVSTHGAADGDGDGQRGDELLSQAGFDFPVERGELYVNVTDQETGQITRTRIAIDPAAMTLQDLADELEAIEHLSASVDPTGRLRVTADAGQGFDFSPRVDPNPDSLRSFGGNYPAIGSNAAGPFDLSGQAFPVTFAVITGTAGSSTTTNVTLDASDFNDPANATVDELVTAINADLGAEGRAANVGGRLVLRSDTGGATSQLTLANVTGTPLTALGLSTATTVGQDSGVNVQLEGLWNGDGNGQLIFEPETDGRIGVTPNLRVRVLDQNGGLVTTVNVGAGYTPGGPIDLGNGLRVKFGAGDISATAGHVFAADVLGDSDTSDVLVALGMNPFFLGSSAADIAVNPDLLANPDRIAAGLGAAASDAGNLLRMVALRDQNLDDLDANTIEDFFADVVGDVGFETAASTTTLQRQGDLLEALTAERDAVSGVNIDEEMVDLVRFQQSYEAAARFIATVKDMTDTLINLGR
ncbi:MAG: flagellar hook-associated protein FlgK [Planctomycetes bacterium]|nr:flagellar hook-associated protein FlgK [Planctomycetota bacterium]